MSYHKCTICCKEQAFSNFSKNQRKKLNEIKCKDCISKISHNNNNNNNNVIVNNNHNSNNIAIKGKFVITTGSTLSVNKEVIKTNNENINK